MAIDLCSESSSATMSPRISFSYDLSQKDAIPVDQHIFRSSSSSPAEIDFDFCVLESFEVESSTADELFFDGKILPIQIKRKLVPLKPIPQSAQPPRPPLPPPRQENDRDSGDRSKIEIAKETKIVSSESEEKQSSKSFWRFNRSSSLNCGSGYARTLCPLPLLSRSNSTGSKNQTGGGVMKHSQSSSSRPPLKKNFSSYGNGVRINPVLNVPSTNLFGFGTIFSNGKDKNKRK